MKKLKFLVLLFFVLTPPLAQAMSFEEIIISVRRLCPHTNNLAIKKVIIELNAGNDCSGPFSSSLIKDCPVLSCTQLSQIITTNTLARTGAVIGK